MVSPGIFKAKGRNCNFCGFWNNSHQSIFCNKFHCNQLSLSVALSSETLSCRQRDLRMFVIYKLCGVGNGFEKMNLNL